MHTRRSATIPSLSLVLPHPPLPRCRASSIRSSNDGYTTPRTPRSSCGLSSPSLLKLDMPAPRTSTDSWNSSIADGGEDDMEWEWTAEQEAMLVKALDSLPAHLLTPFNGSVPPGNLLDKIAKCLIHTKNPVEWPHSIRATRARLHKLARARAEEANSREGRNAGEYSHDVLQQTTNVQKKPLYRQSSMDFLKGNTLKDEKTLERLSTRLQHVERVISDSDPRSASPSGSNRRPFSLSDEPRTPRTPVDSPTHQNIPTIQVAAPSGRAPRLRRSTTTISNLPTIQSGVASSGTIYSVNATLPPQTRSITRIRRSESFSSHGLNGVGHSLKRAPSYGTISNRSHDSSRMSVDEDQKENDPRESVVDIDIYPSSDDEERKRGKKIKKPRTGSTKAVTASASNATLTVPKPTSKSSSAGSSSAKKPSTKSTAKPKTRITRSSSMFGAELPHPQQQPTPPAPRPVQIPVPIVAPIAHRAYHHHHSLSSPLPALDMSVSPSPSRPLSPSLSPVSPSPLPHRTLRRIKTTNFPSRRISFGSLVAKCSLGGPATVQEEVSGEMAAEMSEGSGAAPAGSGLGLGSAFQMQ